MSYDEMNHRMLQSCRRCIDTIYQRSDQSLYNIDLKKRKMVGINMIRWVLDLTRQIRSYRNQGKYEKLWKKARNGKRWEEDRDR